MISFLFPEILILFGPEIKFPFRKSQFYFNILDNDYHAFISRVNYVQSREPRSVLYFYVDIHHTNICQF